MPRGRSFPLDRYWAARLPLPAYFGVVTVLYGVLTWAFDAAGHRQHATLDQLILHVVIGSLYGAGMTVVVGIQRRRSGGPTRQIELARAIRSGAAPADADRTVWTPLLERHIARLRRSRWLAPVLMSPLVIFGIVGWVLVPRAALPAAAIIVLAVGITLLSEVQGARYLPRAVAVLDQVRTATAPSAPRGDQARPAAGRPWTVSAALVLCGVAVLAVAVRAVGFLARTGDVQEVVHDVRVSDHLSAARAEQLATTAVALLLGYWVLLVLATVVLGWFAFTGRNWARGCLVPTTILSLVGLVAPSPTSIVTVVALVAAVVLLYLPATGSFVAQRRPRSQRRA